MYRSRSPDASAVLDATAVGVHHNHCPGEQEREMDSFPVTTRQRNTFLDITAEVRRSLARSRVRDGIGVVYCPHTTAAVTINEGYDPDVVHDMLLWLDRTIPHVQPGF